MTALATILVPVLLAFDGSGRVDVSTPAAKAIGLTELESYHEALQAAPKGPAPPVRFEQLWLDGPLWEGRDVTIEGRVVRQFRQPAVGSFPPLVEVWIASTTGNLTCGVFPDRGPIPTRAGAIRLTGRYLWRIRYESADGPREAPLLVGAEPATAVADPPRATLPRAGAHRIDWEVAVGLLLFVTLVLGVQHFRRPGRRSTGRALPPDFWDPGVEGGEGVDPNPLRGGPTHGP